VKNGKVNCLICGHELDYAAEAKSAVCSICKKESVTNIVCPDGHYVCDECHFSPAMASILEVAGTTESVCPREIAEEMMQRESVAMHGPEHHIITAASIVAAAKNAGAAEMDRIYEAISRAKKTPGGMCGTWGACGAAVGAGIAVSVLCRATPIKAREKSIATRIVATLHKTIADEEAPRCCKRMTRMATDAAAAYIRKTLNIPLADYSGKEECEYVDKNAECITNRCPYYGGSQSGISGR
jgi:hypothetical protein